MQSNSQTLIGSATLIALAYAGKDLSPIAGKLLTRIEQQPDNAAAMMDLATIMLLSQQTQLARELQAEALALQLRYHLAASPIKPGIRMLALMCAGDLMDNTPLGFLLKDSPIAMELHFMQLGAPLPDDLPDFSLCFVAIAEADHNRPLLQQLAGQLNDCPIPVIDKPQSIMRTSREQAATVLHNTPGVLMPASVRISRQQLQQMGDDIAQFLSQQDFPVIVRPVESHAGHGLVKLDNSRDSTMYLTQQSEQQFYISPFIDYSSDDGQFRKYRIVLIDGIAYLCHLAVSSHWIVHYLNADMEDNADKRDEEATVMADFDTGFGRRHRQTFAAIHNAFQLEYLVIDCAENSDGQLLVFEVDTSAIVHDMDPIELFPYKQPQMDKVFRAFQQMISRYAMK